MPTARTGMAQRQGATSPATGRVVPPSEPGTVIGSGSGSAAPGISASQTTHDPCVRCGASMAGKSAVTRYCSLECARGRHVFNPATMCPAHSKRDGRPCTRGKGQGTRHPGYGSCNLHYGNTSRGEAHAAAEFLVAETKRIMAEARKLIARSTNALAYLAIPDDLDPHQQLLEMLRVSAWWERGLREMVASRESLYGANHLGDQRIDVVAEMHLAAMAEHARIAKLCADAGIDKRMVEIAEREADMLGVALDAALAAAGVTDPAALDRANAALVKVLLPSTPSRAELN